MSLTTFTTLLIICVLLIGVLLALPLSRLLAARSLTAQRDLTRRLEQADKSRASLSAELQRTANVMQEHRAAQDNLQSTKRALDRVQGELVDALRKKEELSVAHERMTAEHTSALAQVASAEQTMRDQHALVERVTLQMNVAQREADHQRKQAQEKQHAIERLNQQLQGHLSALTHLQQLNTKHESALANLTRDVAAVQTQLAQAQAWNAKLESQLAYDLDWEKRAEEFQGDLSVRNQELEMTQAKLEEALMRASTQQDAIDQLREELTQKDNGDLQARQLVQQHEQTIADLRQQLAGVNLTLSEKQLSLEQHQSLISDLDGRVKDTASKLDSATVSARGRESLIARLSSYLKNLMPLENVEFETDQLTPEAQLVINQTQERVSADGQNVLVKLTEELVAAQQRAESAETQSQQLQLQINAQQSKVIDLRQQLGSVDQLRAQLDDRNAQIDKLNVEAHNLRLMAQRAQEEFTGADHQNRDLQHRYTEAASRYEFILRKTRALEMANAELQQKNIDLEDALVKAMANGGVSSQANTPLTQADGTSQSTDAPPVGHQNVVSEFAVSDAPAPRPTLSRELSDIAELDSQDIERLNDAGIHSVQDLSASTPDYLRDVLQPSILRRRNVEKIIRDAQRLSRDEDKNATL